MRNGTWSIGTDPDMDIQISAKTVDLEHAIIKVYDEKVFITALNTKHKTIVVRNDKKIAVNEYEQLLENDIVYLGRKKYELTTLIDYINQIEGAKINSDDLNGVNKQQITPAMEEKQITQEVPLIRRIRCYECSTVLNIDYSCYSCGSTKHKER